MTSKPPCKHQKKAHRSGCRICHDCGAPLNQRARAVEAAKASIAFTGVDRGGTDRKFV